MTKRTAHGTMPGDMRRTLTYTAGVIGGFLLTAALWTPSAAAAIADTFTPPCNPYYVAGYEFFEYAPERGAYHAGQDLGCTTNQPVYAIGNGTVVYADLTSPDKRWGNLIIIQHETKDGGYFTSLYGHLSNDRRVSAGQTVVKGQLIGFIGRSYTAENGNWAHHLHLSVKLGAYDAAIGVYSPNNFGYEPFSNRSKYLRPTDLIAYGLPDWNGTHLGTSIGGEVYNGVVTNMYYTDARTVRVHVRNTGGYTWRPDGQSATPVRLGTEQPRNRPSPFFTTNQGWFSPNRIRLTNTASTGQEAVFEATFTSNQTPGEYMECFSPVQETIQWLPGGSCMRIRIEPPGYRAQYVDQKVTADLSSTTLSPEVSTDNMRPGQRVSFKALLRNVGELTWQTTGNPVRLGTVHPPDRSSAWATSGLSGGQASENWLSANRSSSLDGRYDEGSGTVVADTEISPGEVGVFSQAMTAPTQSGYYQEYFNPLAEGHSWMPDLAMWVGLHVAAPGYHHAYVSQTQSGNTLNADTPVVTATLRLRNTGQESWTVGSLRLGTSRPRNNLSPFAIPDGSNAWLVASRPTVLDSNVTSPGKSTVDTGEVGEFAFAFGQPGDIPSGSYNVYFEPLQEGVTWFPEDYGIYYSLNVTNAYRDYSVEKIDYVGGSPTTFEKGTTMTARVAIKNTGRERWVATGESHSIRLGSESPRDRSSVFYTSGGSDPWINLNRPSTIDGRITNLTTMASTPDTYIEPGEIALFSIPLTAPQNTGTYNERFSLVQDGFTWFFDPTASAAGTRNLTLTLTVVD